MFKILECVTGSHLYGTNHEHSDVDIRGIYLPDQYSFDLPQETFTFIGQDDIVLYSLRKFMYLCSQSNPNMIEMLYVPKKWIMSTRTNIWRHIMLNRYLFPSKKSANRFLGYAREQLKRIETHRKWLLNPPTKPPERSDYGLGSRKVVSNDQLGAFNIILKTYMDDVMEFHPLRDIIIKEIGEYPDFLAMIQAIGHKIKDNVLQSLTGMDTNFIHIIQKEKAYQTELRHWNQYLKWKRERNPERAKLEKEYQYDTKHAMHIVRLITEGVELLTNGYITFPRPDAELLISIKNGAYTYDKLMEEFASEDLIKEMINYAKENSELPDECDLNKIATLYKECIQISEKFRRWLK